MTHELSERAEGLANKKQYIGSIIITGEDAEAFKVPPGNKVVGKFKATVKSVAMRPDYSMTESSGHKDLPEVLSVELEIEAIEPMSSRAKENYL